MGVKITKDNRTILSGREYTEHKRGLYDRQDGKCADCGFGFPFNRLDFHHYGGRGMNGSKRNDLDERNRLICRACHDKARFEHLRKK